MNMTHYLTRTVKLNHKYSLTIKGGGYDHWLVVKGGLPFPILAASVEIDGGYIYHIHPFQKATPRLAGAIGVKPGQYVAGVRWVDSPRGCSFDNHVAALEAVLETADELAAAVAGLRISGELYDNPSRKLTAEETDQVEAYLRSGDDDIARAEADDDYAHSVAGQIDAAVEAGVIPSEGLLEEAEADTRDDEELEAAGDILAEVVDRSPGVKVRCKSCDARFDTHAEFNLHATDCPGIVPVVNGESFEEYSARCDAHREAKDHAHDDTGTLDEILEEVDDEQATNLASDDWAVPTGLSAGARKAAFIIRRFAAANLLTHTGGCKIFYTPAEWEAKGGWWGSELVVVHEGADIGRAFSYDSECYSLIEDLVTVLNESDTDLYSEQVNSCVNVLYAV
jgi:hypothetical protein